MRRSIYSIPSNRRTALVEALEDRRHLSAGVYNTPLPVRPDLTPAQAAPVGLAAGASLLVFNAVKTGDPGAAASPSQTVVITNRSTHTVTFAAGAFSIANDPASSPPAASMFHILNAASLPHTLAAGKSLSVSIDFTATTVGRVGAVLKVTATGLPTTQVVLHGIGTSGLGGANEPSLARILRAYNIPTIVGMGRNDVNEASSVYPVSPDKTSQEISMQRLVKAGPGSVTIQDLADFVASSQPSLTIGYYTPGQPAARTNLFYINKSDSQTVNPHPVGKTAFDPGASPFGMFFVSSFKDHGQFRVGYSEDRFNTWDSTQQRKFRFFPLRTAAGALVPNAYVMTTTEFQLPAGYNFHNLVAIIRNVRPSP